MSFFPHSSLREEAPAGGGGGTPPPAGGTPPPPATPPAGGGTPPPPPPSFWREFIGDDGKFNKAALDKLPDDLKPAKDWLGKYENVGAAIIGANNANIVASRKALAPLEPNAPDSAKAERKALLDGVLNVPKDPKGYGLARPQDFPEQFWNQAGADEMSAIAHKHSLSPEAVKELIGLQIKLTRGELDKGRQIEADFFKKQDESFAAEARKLNLTPEKALELATRGAETMGFDVKSDLFKNAEVRRAAIWVAKAIAEDKLSPQNAPGGAPPNYRQQAQSILSDTTNPLNAAFHNSEHPNHKAAVDAYHKLMRQNGQLTRGEKVEA